MLGDVTEGDALDVLRQVDEVYIQTIRDYGLYDKIWQAFAVFLPVRSVSLAPPCFWSYPLSEPCLEQHSLMAFLLWGLFELSQLHRPENNRFACRRAVDSCMNLQRQLHFALICLSCHLCYMTGARLVFLGSKQY